MTTKQENFCDEYIRLGGNATAAAKLAGYSSRGANVQGCNLLNRSDVRAAIDDRLNSLRSDKVVDEKELLEFLSSTVRGEMFDDVATPKGQVVTIRSCTANRLKAAEMLCKIFGLFRQREEDTTTSGAELFVQTLEKIAADLDDE